MHNFFPQKNTTNSAVFLSSADVYGQSLAKLGLINKTESKTVSITSSNMGKYEIFKTTKLLFLS